MAAEAQLKSLCAWLHAGHAISKYIHMLETWIVWWHARIHHWGEHILKVSSSTIYFCFLLISKSRTTLHFLIDVQAMEENDQYLVPRTNLSESIHGSWLATNNGVKYMSLYDACMADLVAACLQGARHASFLGGKHIGEGPDIQRLRDRDSMWKRNAYKQENIIDLTNDVAEKIGVARAHEATSGNTTTVRKKRPRTLSSPIHVDDSHRPEYQKVNKNLQRRHSISTPFIGAEGNDDFSLLQEEEINQTMWAIRRTNPGSVARCQGYLPSKKAKCNRLIDSKGRSGKKGVPSPCFYGRIRRSTIEDNVHSQMIYFCGDSVDHTWNPTNAIHGIPGPAPTRWVVDKGTTLTVDEIKKLQQGGFNLQGITEEKLASSQTRRVHIANAGGKARPVF